MFGWYVRLVCAAGAGIDENLSATSSVDAIQRLLSGIFFKRRGVVVICGSWTQCSDKVFRSVCRHHVHDADRQSTE